MSNDDKTSNYKVVSGSTETAILYNDCLEFVDGMVAKYADRDDGAKYNAMEIISGMTHCMIKIMFNTAGFENTSNWFEQVKQLHVNENQSKSHNVTVEKDNSTVH